MIAAIILSILVPILAYFLWPSPERRDLYASIQEVMIIIGCAWLWSLIWTAAVAAC